MNVLTPDDLAELVCAVFHDKPRPRDLFPTQPAKRRACALHIALAERLLIELGGPHDQH